MKIIKINNMVVVIFVVFAALVFFFYNFTVNSIRFGSDFAASLFWEENLNNKDNYQGLENCLKSQKVIFYGIYGDVNTEKQIKELVVLDVGDFLVNCIEEKSGEFLFDCQKEGVTVFPTWIIDDNKIERVLSINDLQEIVNCDV